MSDERVVWKFKLPSLDAVFGGQFEFCIKMPKDAKILCLDKQLTPPFRLNGELPYIWAIVNPDAQIEDRKFFSVGTGFGTVPEKSKYIGSIINAYSVWHIFEE